MAVSGSKNYSITRADIVEGALRKLGEYDQSETVPGDESNAAGKVLNLMVKAWAARGAARGAHLARPHRRSTQTAAAAPRPRRPRAHLPSLSRLRSLAGLCLRSGLLVSALSDTRARRRGGAPVGEQAVGGRGCVGGWGKKRSEGHTSELE